MKKYPHIISKLFYEPLIVTRAKHAEMVRVLDSHLAKLDAAPAMPMPEEMPEEDDPGMIVVRGAAIIPVHGVLVGHASDIPMSSCGCGLDDLAVMVEKADSSSKVERIVFDFRTPGGAVTGVPEMGRKIASVRKPTVAFTDSDCCSGGLWLAAQCQEFYATGSSGVGSIGVWCAYFDYSRQLQNEGVNVQEFSAGKYKTMGAWWKPLSKEEEARIQASVDKIYSQFKEAVQLYREVSDDVMQGQIFDGEEALAAGLIDGVVEDLDQVLEGDV